MAIADPAGTLEDCAAAEQDGSKRSAGLGGDAERPWLALGHSMFALAWLWIAGCGDAGGGDKGPVDDDGDGYAADVDCDDADASRWDQEGVFEGEVTEADVLELCGGWCRLSVDGDVELNLRDFDADGTEAAIDALDCVTDVSGEFTISGVDHPVQLDALAQLTAVHGLGLSSSTGISSLVGLGALVSTTTLSFDELPGLTDLRGLGPITSIDRVLSLYRMDGLTSLAGLETVESVGELWVNENDALQSLDGFEPTGAISNGVTIEHDDALAEVSSLRGVTEIGGTLSLRWLPALMSLDGFEGVETVDDVVIQEADALASLQGLGGLQSATTIELTENAGLASLEGLGPAEVKVVTVTGNPALVSLAGMSEDANLGNVYLVDNDALETLDGLPLVRGTATLELEGNDRLWDLTGAGVFGARELELTIRSCPSVVDLSTLAGFDEWRSLVVEDNAALRSFAGLEGVEEISSGLSASGNPVLEDLSAFASLRSVGSLSFTDNPCLAEGDVDTLAAQVGVTPTNEGNTGPCD